MQTNDINKKIKLGGNKRLKEKQQIQKRGGGGVAGGVAGLGGFGCASFG